MHTSQRDNGASNATIKLHLHGDLRRFGTFFELVIARPIEAISALSAQIDGFDTALRNGRYHLWTGDSDPQSNNGQSNNQGDGASNRLLNTINLYEPVGHSSLHLAPVIGGSGKGDGKMLLGLTLLGLSFVPGVQAGIAGAFGQAGNAVGGAKAGELAGMFGSRLLGGAATWLILSGASDALAPQPRHPAGQTQSAAIGASAPVGEGAPIPLVYGKVRITAPPIVSAGLRVQTEPLGHR